jgi:mRNA degradation ribonuclease J1/J2
MAKDIQVEKSSGNSLIDTSAIKAINDSVPISRSNLSFEGIVTIRVRFGEIYSRTGWPVVEIVDDVTTSNYELLVAKKILKNWKMQKSLIDDTCILTFDLNEKRKASNILIKKYARNLSTENTAMAAVSAVRRFPTTSQIATKKMHFMVGFSLRP